jgi:protein-S-isoprenylcysteine O-methyltransferase Ste14
MVFWATPTMSAGHMLFAIATTFYILVAIQFEEQDLIRSYDHSYPSYKQHTPMLYPVRFGKDRSSNVAVEERVR